MTAIDADVMRLRNTSTGEVVEVPLTIDVTEDDGLFTTTITADTRDLPGGDYEAITPGGDEPL